MKFYVEFHNFSNLQRILSPRIIIKKLQDLLSTQLGYWGVPPCGQKFLIIRLSDFMFNHLSKHEFEFEKLQNWWFRGAVFSTRGVRPVRNFFLTRSPSVRTKTPRQTKKTSDTSPAPWESILVPIIEKYRFVADFAGKRRFFDVSW